MQQCRQCQKTYQKPRGPVSNYCSRECRYRAQYVKSPKMPRLCIQCCKPFESHFEARWCSEACREIARAPKCVDCGKPCTPSIKKKKPRERCQKCRHEYHLANRQSNCLTCGIRFHKKDNTQRYCSVRCLNRGKIKGPDFYEVKAPEQHEYVCRICTEVFSRPHPVPEHIRSDVCSQTCMKPIWAAETKRRWEEKHPIQTKTCIYCHELFDTRFKDKYCTNCVDANEMAVRAVHRLGRRRAKDARAARISYCAHSVSPRHVYESQHGKCAMCKAVKTLTLDHIVPISKGGMHQRWNLRGLCSECNTIKSNHLKFAYVPANRFNRPITCMGMACRV